MYVGFNTSAASGNNTASGDENTTGSGNTAIGRLSGTYTNAAANQTSSDCVWDSIQVAASGDTEIVIGY